MFGEQRNALDEMIVKMRAGRLTRRSFLERATVIGLSSTAAMSLLDACGGGSSSSSGPVNLVWQSDNDTSGTYQNIVNTFNSGVGKQKGVHVTLQLGPASTDDLLTKYNNSFRARSSTPDVISLDIVYPAQFAAQGWIKPITTDMWSTADRDNYLSGPVQGCTYQGTLYAAPFRTDLGVLYYRKDLMSSTPQTWDDLVSASKSVSPSKVKYGYVWQGDQYEGLVCDFVEVLYGYNGSILDPNDSTKVTVNSPEALAALTQMVSWVGTISPAAITTYEESQALATWQAGDAAFMRNWPYAYSLSNTPADSKIVDKFDITSLPYGGSGTVGHSAIGGWNLAISAYSQHSDAAWEFIQYMMSSDAQKEGAIGASWTTTLKSVYTDADVLQKEPLFGKLQPILQNAKPRPVSPRYADVSQVIQRDIHSALKKQVTPAQALQTLASDLAPLVK